MKKNLIKATLFVAAVALTSTASLVAYDRYQQSQFAAANPLLKENLEALADPYTSGYSDYTPGDNNGKKSERVYVIQTRSFYKCTYIAASLKAKLPIKVNREYTEESYFGYQDSIRYQRRDQYKGTCENDYEGNYRGCKESNGWQNCASSGCPTARTYMNNAEWDQYNCGS